MNLEQLEKGNKIAKKIENCKANIKAVSFTQSESVEARKTYLKINGVEESIEVPEGLFRIVGKLILVEYQQDLIQLEREFQDIA
jgi:hypothetical protein